MSNPSEIDRRFSYHAPTETTRVYHEIVGELILKLAHQLDEILPAGREKSLVLTHLEDVRMRANQAIAVTELQLPPLDVKQYR